MIGVEASGYGIPSGRHAAPLCAGSVGVLHGNKTYLLQDSDGQIAHAHSISAGLDYPGVGPEHAWLKDSGRAEYVSITDDEALEGFKALTREEGIIPALESSMRLLTSSNCTCAAEGAEYCRMFVGTRRQGYAYGGKPDGC